MALALALAPHAAAAPGSPGIPGAPPVIFEEDFENVPNPPQPGPPVVNGTFQFIDQYTGDPPQSMTYTADPSWISLAQCNGMVLSFNTTNPPGSCGGGFNALRSLAQALGAFNPPPAGANFNHALSAWTSTALVETTPDATLETEDEIPLSSANRFITFSVDVGVTSCGAPFDPLLRFFLLDGPNEIEVTDSSIDVCADPSGSPPPPAATRTGTYASDGSILVSSPTAGFKLTNDQGQSNGNDYAYDNVRMLDGTPQLDKEFESPTPRGVPTELTFTITNTSDLAAKEGWSFTDTLPAGLTVADPAGTTTNCTNGSIAATAGGDTIEVSGDLEANRASCTGTVEVVADEPGDYENCPANLSDIVGLDPPACDTLTVLPVADLQVTKLVEPGPYLAGELVHYTLTVLNNGPNTAEDVQLTDDLPSGLTFLSATPEQGTCSQSDPIDCDLGTIANGDSVEIDVTAEIAPGQEGNPVVNTATVEAETPDTNQDNNSADAAIDVEPEDGPSYLAKRGFDPTTNSTAASGGPTGTTGAGNLIDWVVSYRNQTGVAANVNITDPITGNHRFVSGSLETPPGLEPRWSTDGGILYDTPEPPFGVNGVGATGTSIPGSTGAQVQAAPPPPSSVPAGGGGDGFEPLFIGDNVYNVYHHRGGMSGANPITVLDCHVKVAGVRCPGYPTYVSPNAGDEFGTGPSTLTTGTFTQAAVSGSRIYYPVGVIGTRDDGIVCADVATQTSCGFTQLGSYSGSGTNGNNTSATINGGAVMGSRYYTVSHDGEIYCFDVSTETPCQGYAPTVSDPTAPALRGWPFYNLQAWDDRYLFGVFARPGTNPVKRDLICIDVTTDASCPGFPRIGAGGISSGSLHNSTMVPILNSSGDVTGICAVTATNFAEHPFACFDLNGNPVDTPFSTTQTSGTVVNAYSFGSVGVVGSRIYFAETTQSNGRATYTCWDYSVTPSAPGKIGNVCPGFVPASTLQNVRAYTIRQDPQNPECLWQLGDASRFEVFSATFGGTGCRFGNALVRLEPEDYYCDGADHVSGWEAIRLIGLTAADYDGLAVTITDENGNPVPGWQNRSISNASQTIDISSIPHAGSTTTLNIAVAISWGSKPVKPVTVRSTFDGDPPQLCFQTRVRTADCTEGQQITNNANAITNGGPGNSDAPAGNDTGPVTFDLPADSAACRTDLELEKTSDAVNGAVAPGGAVEWTLTVTNHGPDASTGATVTDQLPTGVTNLQTTTPGCAIEGSLLTCDLGPLDPDATTEIVVTGNAPQAASTCFENSASVEADEPDPDLDNNDASTRTCTNAAADLEIEKSAEPALVSPSGQVTWTLTVTNHGPDASTGSTVTDDLPDNLANVATTTPGCTVEAGNLVTCEVDALDPDATAEIEITADAPNTPATCFENAATVEGEEGDPVSENDEDSVRACTTPDADLELTKTAAEFVDPNGEVTWTLTVTNNGTEDSSGATVTDTLPAGITGAATETPGCSIEDNELTCEVEELEAGLSTDIVVTGTAPDEPGTCFTNDAFVEGSSAQSDPDLENNDASARTCTREADLELTKTIDDDLVSPGTGVTWTITVTNNGPDQSPAATVTDTLPAGVTNVATDDPRCEVTGNEVSCDIDPLGDDDSTDVVLTGDAPAASSTCFENAASVASESDLVEGNNDDSVRACTTPIANLALQKSATAVVDPGGEVTWTIRATNLGPDPSTGLTVTDTLPDGVTDVTAPSCTVDGQTVTCTSEQDLAVDEFIEFEITGTAPNVGSECFENAASVEGERGDPNLENNDASAETCTNEGADLQIDKVAADGARFAGDQVTYTLSVENNGPATAHDVTVTDDLPDGLTLVSASPEADCTQSDPVTCDVGTLAPSGTAEITIVATIGANQAGNGIENTSCVGADEPDPFEANDCDTEPIIVESEADLAITKTVDPGTPVQLGDTVTYTLLVQNLGPNEDNLVRVTDDFVQGSAEVLEVTPSQGSCQGEDPITCELGAILSGGEATITVVARPLQKGTLRNQAVVDPSITDRNPENNEDEATTRALAPNLDLKKRASKGRARPGEVFSYKITLRNRGEGVATDVRVCDRVPAGLKVLRAPRADKRTKRRVCWLVESLAAGAKRTFRITVQVKDNVKPGKRLRNVAVAKGANGDKAKAGDKVGIAPTGDDCPRFARC